MTPNKVTNLMKEFNNPIFWLLLFFFQDVISTKITCNEIYLFVFELHLLSVIYNYFLCCSLQRASTETGQSDLKPQVGTLVCMRLWLYKLYRITLVSVMIWHLTLCILYSSFSLLVV